VETYVLYLNIYLVRHPCLGSEEHPLGPAVYVALWTWSRIPTGVRECKRATLRNLCKQAWDEFNMHSYSTTAACSPSLHYYSSTRPRSATAAANPHHCIDFGPDCYALMMPTVSWKRGRPISYFPHDTCAMVSLFLAGKQSPGSLVLAVAGKVLFHRLHRISALQHCPAHVPTHSTHCFRPN
jgi:hypothetical protein